MERLTNAAQRLGLDINKSYLSNTGYKVPERGKILLDDINQKVVFNEADFGTYFLLPMARIFDMEDYNGKK